MWTGQTLGKDGFIWWRGETGGWLRSDVVLTQGNCQSVALLNPPPAYCGTRTEFAERPDLGRGAQIYDSPRFRIHFTLEGEDATTTEYIKEMARALEHTLIRQVDEMGWPEPPPDCGEGGDSRFDVYVLELDDDGIYGYAEPNQYHR